MYKLCELKYGQTATVKSVKAQDMLLARFTDIGIIEDTVIKCVAVSPQGDPKAYAVRGAQIALRNRDAALIEVGAVDG